MAQHKSAKKRIRTAAKARMRNRRVKSRVKKTVRRVNDLLAAAATEGINDDLKKKIEDNLTIAVSVIHKSVSKGVFHRNTAARKISRLTRAVRKHTSQEETPAE